MKQLELFPCLLDQKVIDYYHLILRKIKLLKKADLDWINLLDEYGEMRKQAEKDREEYSIPDSIDDIRDFKYRRYIMKLHKEKWKDDLIDGKCIFMDSDGEKEVVVISDNQIIERGVNDS